MKTRKRLPISRACLFAAAALLSVAPRARAANVFFDADGATTAQLGAATVGATGTWSDAAARAMPSVVNIYTTARVSPRERNPALDDPFFQFFFGDRMPGGRGRGEAEPRQRPASLGSGVVVGCVLRVLPHDSTCPSIRGVQYR
jgi:S1-C subfamily serine protease